MKRFAKAMKMVEEATMMEDMATFDSELFKLNGKKMFKIEECEVLELNLDQLPVK